MMLSRFVPSAVKRPLKNWYSSQLLSTGLQALRSGAVSDRELTQVRLGWDNDGWDAKPVFLRELLSVLQATTGSVLECGSGLSTLVMAAVAPARHRVSLEHHAAWARRVRTALQSHDLNADVRIAPLVEHENGLRWYSTEQTVPNDIGLVVCDGPDCYGRGRYAVLPIIRSHLRPGAVILFDDAAAEGQPEVLDAWAAEFGVAIDRRHADGVDYAIVRVP